MNGKNPPTGRQMTWEETHQLILWISDKLHSTLHGKIRLTRNLDTLSVVEDRFGILCQHANIDLPEHLMKRIYDGVLDELLGYEPIDLLLRDDTITEVMVNGPDQVYVERAGRVTQSSVRFLSEDHIMRVINKIIEPLGRSVNRAHPMVDARLPDGSRVNAIIPPCAIDSPTITIRKFSKNRLTVELWAAVAAAMSLAVSLARFVTSRPTMVMGIPALKTIPAACGST